MSNNSEKKIELKIKSKLEQKKKKKTLDDGFKKNKVINEVLDIHRDNPILHFFYLNFRLIIHIM